MERPNQTRPLPLPTVDPSPRLPRLFRLTRDGGVLRPTPLAGDDEVLGLNLTRGCWHRCCFCSVRASPHHPPAGEVPVYADTAERLAADLDARPQRPRAVFLSPGSDPFPPLDEVQSEASRVIDVLAGRGVPAWIMTRGLIRPPALEVIAARRDLVRVTVGLCTLDRRLQRDLETWAAPPRLRLKQIERLLALGVPVQVEVGPLLPGLTDPLENLKPLIAALAAAGARHVSTGYAFLREGIGDHLKAALGDRAGPVLAAYSRGPLLTAPGLATARYLPRGRRQRGYATLLALAAEHGLTVGVCGLINPDLTPPRAADAAERPRLLSSFLEAGRELRQA
jgi:DNA repair photolyase